MTNYQTAGIKSPFQMMKEKGSFQNPKNPVAVEAAKNTGTIDIRLTIEQDTQTLDQFRTYPGVIAFKCTLRKGSGKNTEVCGVGRGSTIIGPNNKYYSRSLAVAKNCSIIDSVMQATKMLNILVPDACDKKDMPVVEGKELDLEGRDRVCSFEDDGTLRHASEKQKAFLKSLIETKCDQSARAEYLSQLNEKYLSSFQASELISSLLPIK